VKDRGCRYAMVNVHRFILILLGCVALVAAAETDGPFKLDSDEFPIGLFSVDSPAAMPQVAKMGVGYIHTYGNGRSSKPEGIRKDLAYLDAAHEHGLRVMFNLNGHKWVGAEGGLQEMLKIVEAVKGHPALGFWYLYDEPDGRHTPDQLKPFYAALKQATPDVPVAIAAAWSKKWYTYNDVLDLLMIDTYPVQHRPFPESKLDIMTRFTDGALRLGKPVIPINQCFNWKALAGKKETYRGSPTARMRYPTKDELRYWCYSGAAQGVRGMFWWSYYRSVQIGYGWIGTTFAEVMREFSEFTKLTAPTHKPDVFSRARDTNIIMARWRRPGGDFLVVVNAWPLERPISRWTEDKIANATLRPWGATRDVEAKLENGTLTVGSAKPWEVFVWKLDIQ